MQGCDASVQHERRTGTSVHTSDDVNRKNHTAESARMPTFCRIECDRHITINISSPACSDLEPTPTSSHLHLTQPQPNTTTTTTAITMHWLFTLTALASAANICAAVPGRTPVNRLFSRQDDFPKCTSGSNTCFGASVSTKCRDCEATCFSVDSEGELCKASCVKTARPGSGSWGSVMDCACDKKCLAGT